MTELIRYIAGRLVDKPECMRIEECDEHGTHIIRLFVAESDMGKVIGRRGRIAKSIRTVAKAASLGGPERCSVEFAEENVRPSAEQQA